MSAEAVAALSGLFFFLHLLYFLPFNDNEKRAPLGLAVQMFVEETGTMIGRWRQVALNPRVLLFCFVPAPALSVPSTSFLI